MNIQLLENDKNTIKQDVIKLLVEYIPHIDSNVRNINIDETDITKDWLQGIKLLVENNKKRILSSLEKSQKIVIKISNNISLHSEYLISKHMNKKINNFCNYDYLYSDKYDCIIMPYYELGSFKDFNWNDYNNVLYTSTAQILSSYLCAYHLAGFIHNECHLGNYLIDKTDDLSYTYEIDDNIINVPTHGIKIYVMDFETSIFDFKKNNQRIFISDISKILSDIRHKINNDVIFNAVIKSFNVIKSNNYLDIVDIINYLIEVA